MTLARLLVVEIDGAWRIHLDGEPVARFAREIEALNCVAGMASVSQGEGRDVEVLVQEADQEVSVLGLVRSSGATP